MPHNKTKKGLIIEFHCLLRQTKQAENKGVMVASFGKESTKDLTTDELDTLITRLRDLIPATEDTPKPLRRARSTVLKLLEEMDVVGWKSVNAYLEDKRIFGKRLNATTDLDETKALARKLRVIKRQRDEKVQHENYLSTNN
jgi:hypothetical protein